MTSHGGSAPARSRRLGGCSPGWAGGRLWVHTWSSIKLFNVEMELALFLLGAWGLGAGGHAHWGWESGSGLTGGHLWAAGGSAHPRLPSRPPSGPPGGCRPSPHPSHTPFENKLWDPGSRGIPGPPPWWRGPLRPPCRWCGPPSAAQSTVQARPPTPPQTWCLTGAWRFPAPSGQFPE